MQAGRSRELSTLQLARYCIGMTQNIIILVINQLHRWSYQAIGNYLRPEYST